jgi:hypothetical protein
MEQQEEFKISNGTKCKNTELEKRNSDSGSVTYLTLKLSSSTEQQDT